MKKVIIFALMMMLVVATYVVADQTIKSNGYHNIPGRLANSAPEVCAYCHIPHRANTSSLAPLGNRTASNATAFCESCHDGTAVNSGILRNPLTGTLTGGTIGSTSNAYIASGTHIVGGVNHPSGIVGGNTYGWSANGPDGKVSGIGAALDTPSNANTALNATYAFNLGGSGATIHCTSCHYVHRKGTDTGRAFLRISNSNSALCVACHNI